MSEDYITDNPDCIKCGDIKAKEWAKKFTSIEAEYVALLGLYARESEQSQKDRELLKEIVEYWESDTVAIVRQTNNDLRLPDGYDVELMDSIDDIIAKIKQHLKGEGKVELYPKEFISAKNPEREI